VARGPTLIAAALAALRADGYPLAVVWTPGQQRSGRAATRKSATRGRS